MRRGVRRVQWIGVAVMVTGSISHHDYLPYIDSYHSIQMLTTQQRFPACHEQPDA